jgi:hypothetical protein
MIKTWPNIIRSLSQCSCVTNSHTIVLIFLNLVVKGSMFNLRMFFSDQFKTSWKNHGISKRYQKLLNFSCEAINHQKTGWLRCKSWDKNQRNLYKMFKYALSVYKTLKSKSFNQKNQKENTFKQSAVRWYKILEF